MDYISVDFMIKSIFAICFVIAFVADTVLIIVLSRSNLMLSNSYYSLHRKFGSLKITSLKLIAILFFIYSLLLEPSGKSGSIFFIITAYCVIVIKLFVDYMKARKCHSGDSP